ncbi:MAG: 4Fe-4S binding protein, partial [candidate division WOR-3 bacterium]
MSLTVKLTELFLGVIKGKVTISYPYIECEAPTRYRGRPIFDANKCIGCGGCASNCPTRAILVSDPCQE